jgi:hypothetical protein
MTQKFRQYEHAPMRQWRSFRLFVDLIDFGIDLQITTTVQHIAGAYEWGLRAEAPKT